MTLHRIRSTVATSLLVLLALLTAALPTPGSATGLGDTPQLLEAAQGARVVVSGGVAAIESAVTELGGQIVARMPVLGAAVADVPAESVARLELAPGITAVTADEPVQLQSTGDAQGAPADGTGAESLGAHAVWAEGIDGSGVGIAVVDTGVSQIADLSGRVRGGVDLTAENDGVDRYGHGTPIAWLAAGDGAASDGRWTGVAPGAHVVPVKIAGADGRTEIARVLVALDWVARNADTLDIRVVNLSLGSAPAAMNLIDAAVQRLWDLGLVVVVAAGNTGPDTLGTPANNTHVITVGSSQGQGTADVTDDVAAAWSSTGVDADGVAKPDLTVPGQSLVVAGAPGSWGYDQHPAGHLGDGYQRVSGTSFSAGLVSGAAALALQAHPEWTPDQVLGQLFEGARPVDGTHAPVPDLAVAIADDTPTAANVGASQPSTTGLEALGPPTPGALASAIGGNSGRAVGLGKGLYSTGWYSTGWYSTGWYGKDWSSTGWYSTGWYSTGWYSTGWYSTGWYSTGWYSTGWYSTGWY